MTEARRTVVALGGEGIGPKVVGATCQLPLAAGFPVETLAPGPTSNPSTVRPDIAGRGIANPTATIRSAAMMLDPRGLGAESKRLEAAVARVDRDGKALTPDQGGAATTREFCQAVLSALPSA